MNINNNPLTTLEEEEFQKINKLLKATIEYPEDPIQQRIKWLELYKHQQAEEREQKLKDLYNLGYQEMINYYNAVNEELSKAKATAKNKLAMLEKWYNRIESNHNYKVEDHKGKANIDDTYESRQEKAYTSGQKAAIEMLTGPLLDAEAVLNADNRRKQNISKSITGQTNKSDWCKATALFMKMLYETRDKNFINCDKDELKEAFYIMSKYKKSTLRNTFGQLNTGNYTCSEFKDTDIAKLKKMIKALSDYLPKFIEVIESKK